MSDKYSTVESQASYGIAYHMDEQLASNPFDGLDVETVLTGLADGFSRAQSQVDNNDLRAAFTEIHERMQAAKQEQFAGAVEEGIKFLEENGQREGIVITESGLQYEILTVGNGDMPTSASTVRTNYHGTLINGEVFDSSYERGQPAEFPVGGVIKGWTEALTMMPVGSKWRLYVPHDLAYGEQGAGGAIGPFSTLIFDIELLDIVG